MGNVRKQIEEKINSGLIAAHHVCTDRINQIQRELEERKRIKYDLYLQETKECRGKTLGLERESICNSKKAQMLIWEHDYDEVEMDKFNAFIAKMNSDRGIITVNHNDPFGW